MKGRLLWFLVPIAALAIVAVWWWQQAPPPSAKPVVARPVAPVRPEEPSPEIKLQIPTPTPVIPTPTPVVETMSAPRPVVPVKPAEPVVAPKPTTEIAIEDGKTIDFSRGAPQVKDTANEQAALARALKEMEEATKDVTFGPTAPAPAANKKAEPSVTPPNP